MSELSMNQDDRISFLRERGVEIEFPEDRNVPKVDDDINNKTASRKVYVVKIPCDEREELSEIQIPVKDGDNTDQMILILRIYFNSSTYQTKTKQIVEELKKNAPTMLGNTDISVSDSTLENLTQNGNVEAFSLVRPSPTNDFCGVSFYLDEIGSLKKLPLNKRAVAIAALCGYDNVPLLGDMFIGQFVTRTASFILLFMYH